MKNLIYASVLLFLIIVILTAPALAQEKQSDATWEETMEFIEKYSTYLEAGSPYQIANFQITSNTFNGKLKFTKVSNFKIHSTFPLVHLKKVVPDNPSVIRLYLSGKQGREYSTHNNKEWDSGSFLFYVHHSEMRTRLLKAFQHLAYLATEYREEQRKASGDAF